MTAGDGDSNAGNAQQGEKLRQCLAFTVRGFPQVWGKVMFTPPLGPVGPVATPRGKRITIQVLENTQLYDAGEARQQNLAEG